MLRVSMSAGLLAASAWCAGTPDELACDKTNIEWVLPGNFEEARKRAQEQKRLLIVKGVSFGIDEVGAKCATKGKW